MGQNQIGNEKLTKIMLVDDNYDQLLVLSALLNKENYDVVSVGSAKAALDNLEHEHFDIVVTDICMPEMNGLQLASNLRKLNGYQSTPIVLITAGRETIDFSSQDFKADAFCLKKQIKESLLPVLAKLRKTISTNIADGINTISI